MTDPNFIYHPRRGDEVLRAAPRGTKIYLYSDLCRDPRSARDIVLSLGRNSLILVQDPDDMKTGHWTSLSIHPERKEIYFFSSYGGMPDKEKIQWVRRSKLIRSGQIRNVLNDGLKALAMEGWVIHYNDYPYQHVGDRTATCGIWATAFMNSRKNPDEFENSHRPLADYFEQYYM